MRGTESRPTIAKEEVRQLRQRVINPHPRCETSRVNGMELTEGAAKEYSSCYCISRRINCDWMKYISFYDRKSISCTLELELKKVSDMKILSQSD